MNLDNDIVKLTAELYANLAFSRDDVQFVITLISNFIKDSYNPKLLSALNNNLYKAISKEALEEIISTFNLFNDPFEKYSKEQKRLTLYKEMNLFEDPEENILICTKKVTKNGIQVFVREKKYCFNTYTDTQFTKTNFLNKRIVSCNDRIYKNIRKSGTYVRKFHLSTIVAKH